MRSLNTCFGLSNRGSICFGALKWEHRTYILADSVLLAEGLVALNRSNS